MGIHGNLHKTRRCFWAALALLTISVGSIHAQGVSEPDGMPVYRQKRGVFFQNPFSTGYQRLWNKAKGTNKAEPTVTSQENVVQSNTNAGYALADEAEVISVEGEPVATPQPVVSRPRHVVRKPLTGLFSAPAAKSTNKKVVPNKPEQRVVHVNNVNEGTPEVGTEYDVTPDEFLMKSLGPGEQITSVKERVIGVYRDGKLVPVPASKNVQPYAPGQKDIDPWFGDEVSRPSEEVQSLDAIESDSVPPQSFNSGSDIPELPVVEENLDIEQTSYQPEMQEMIYVPLPSERRARPSAINIGNTAANRIHAISNNVARKYQTNYGR